MTINPRAIVLSKSPLNALDAHLAAHSPSAIVDAFSACTGDGSAVSFLLAKCNNVVAERFIGRLLRCNPTDKHIGLWVWAVSTEDGKHSKSLSDMFVSIMGKVIVTRTVVAAALSTLKLRHPLTLPDDVANMKKMLTMVLRMVARTPRMITLIPLMAHFVVHPSDELGTLLVANGLVATKKAELRLLFDTVVSAFHDHAGAPNGARWFCTFARTAVQGVETRMLQRLVTHNCTVLLSGMLEMSTSLTQLNSVVAAPNMPTTPDVYNAILMGTAAVRRRSDKHPRLETLLSKVCFRWGCTATYCTVAALIDVCKWPESPRHTAAFSAYVCDVFALLAADGQFIRHLHTGCPKSNTRKHRMSIAVYTMIGTAPARCLQEHVVAAARAVEPITLNTHCALLWRHLVRSIVDPSAMGGMQYTVEHALGEVALNRHWTSSDKTPADARSMWAWAVAHISNYHLVPAMLNFLDPKDISNRIIHSLLQHDIPLPARLFGPCKWTMLACGEFGNAGLRVQLAGTIGVSVPEMLADNEAGRTAALQCAQHLYLDKTISNHRKLHHFKILAACPHRQLFDPRLAFGMTHKCESWLHPAHHHKTAATVLAAYNRATATKTGILAHIPLEIVLMIVEMATAF